MRLSWAVGDITGKNTQRAAAAGLVMATALLSASGPRRSFLRRLRGARATALLAAAGPAAAQTEVWSATLTPAALETGILGCSNSIVDGECSDTSILSEDSFTHDSTDYSVTGLFVNADGALRLQIVPVITTATGTLTLMVGSTSLVLAEADIRVGGRRQWTSSGASLTVGTDIAVKLITPDTTPPTVQNSVVSATGQLVYISFSEDVDQSNLPPASAFTVTVDGSAVTVSNVITDPDPMFTTTLGISVSPTIRHGQAVVVTYTDPTAGNDANAIQDAAGNDVATFTTGVGGVQVVGNQSTVAGTGALGFGGDGGPAVQARFRTPYGVAVDGAGNLFIADSSNHRIRMVDPAGTITTVAGGAGGVRGYSGDGGPAVEAARVEYGLNVEPAMQLLGMPRTSYYRHVRGMTDYTPRLRAAVAMQHRDTFRDVALKRPEAGHRKVREYAVAWQQLTRGEPGTSRMSCYRVLKADGLIQPGRPGTHLKEIRDRRRQMLEVPTEVNHVLQCDFTDYETEDGETYNIGCVTEYLSRFNLVSLVLDTETAADLIRVTEAALDEIAQRGHALPPRVVVVTDNGPAMKSRRRRNFIKGAKGRLVHVRGQKYHPQTIGREERYHGSLKLEWLYRHLPRDRSELVDRVECYRRFYNHERLHESLDYRTPASVYLTTMAQDSSYSSAG